MSATIDQTALASLYALNRPGKPDVAGRVIGMFCDDAPVLVAAIESGIASNDAESTRLAAHSLKSSAAYVGAVLLSEASARIERAAREGNVSQCVLLGKTLGALLAHSIAALDQVEAKAA